jgi:hypothetical protein
MTAPLNPALALSCSAFIICSIQVILTHMLAMVLCCVFHLHVSHQSGTADGYVLRLVHREVKVIYSYFLSLLNEDWKSVLVCAKHHFHLGGIGVEDEDFGPVQQEQNVIA